MMAIGKKVGKSLYIHKCGLHLLEDDLIHKIKKNLKGLNIYDQERVNVYRISLSLENISYLVYKDFFTEPFPSLEMSWKVTFKNQEIIRRDFSNSKNPLILHRKELLLPKDHEKYQEYESITIQLDKLGAFEQYNKIGRRNFWNQVLDNLNVEVKEGKVIRKNKQIEKIETVDHEIDRYKTAISRYSLSKPMKILARYDYLNGENTIFDYGCGKGDDVNLLREGKLVVDGWDPYYYPQHKKISADIVNIGFVINVIEDAHERVFALKEAFSLARKMLIISVMLEFSNSSGEEFLDGVITSRNTFQKYYSQGELIEYTTKVLGKNTIPVASGVVIVFKDQMLQQDFVEKRTRRLSNQSYFESKWFRIKDSRISQGERKYIKHREKLDLLWLKALSLGREPHFSDLLSEELVYYKEHFGSVKKAFNIILKQKDIADFEKSREMSKESLIVFLARVIFSDQKTTWIKKDPKCMRDIKYFFGTMKQALSSAREVLFKVGDPSVLYHAGLKAEKSGIAYIEKECLYILTTYINIAPAVLRIYVNCASYLVGDIEEYDLIKIHYVSKKLSLMKFNNRNYIIPCITERVKVRLGNNSLQIFEYNQDRWPPKAFIKLIDLIPSFSDEYEKYNFNSTIVKQIFEENIDVNEAQVKDLLHSYGYHQTKNGLIRNAYFPEMQSDCGKYLCYKDLIVRENPIQELNSFYALCDLILYIIDPICEYYGEILISRGLRSSFNDEIEEKLYPQLCALEKNKQGKRVNPDKGAGLLFSVEYEDMFEVAEWIATNLPVMSQGVV